MKYKNIINLTQQSNVVFLNGFERGDFRSRANALVNSRLKTILTILGKKERTNFDRIIFKQMRETPVNYYEWDLYDNTKIIGLSSIVNTLLWQPIRTTMSNAVNMAYSNIARFISNLGKGYPEYFTIVN